MHEEVQEGIELIGVLDLERVFELAVEDSLKGDEASFEGALGIDNEVDEGLLQLFADIGFDAVGRNVVGKPKSLEDAGFEEGVEGDGFRDDFVGVA
jgi:hypothetical protein